MAPPNPQPNTPTPEQAQGPKGVVGEPDFQDEEIEIPAEEGAAEGTPAPAAEATETEQPKEKKRRGPKRYAALTHERDEARGYAANLEQELLRERQRALELEAKAQESAKVAMQSFASKAETDLKQARAEYASAQESGDVARITAAAEQLASAKQTADDIKAWENTEKAKPAAQPQQQVQQQARPQIQDYPEPVKEWVLQDHNRYWDANARDDNGNILIDRGGRPIKNPDFDEEMHIEATMFATKLERQIAAGKLGYKVASKEYFNAIETHMLKEFPEYFGGEGEEVETPAPRPRSSPVAAPSRSTPGNGSNGASSKVKLTGDQLRFVKKQVENGGGPRYPKGHPQQFKPMSYDDAKVSFARRLQTQDTKNQ